MALNYTALQATATKQLRDMGSKVSFFREGIKVTDSFAIQVESEQKDETDTPSSLLAQTSQTAKSFMVAATTKSIRTGDTMVRGTNSFYVTSVSEFAPSGVTLYLEVTVV